MSQPRRHTDLRFRADTGFEAKCLLCLSWWPMTLEYWSPKNGLYRCLSCWRSYKRAYERGRRGDDAVAEAKRESNRLAYWENRPRNLAAQRVWRARNRERIAAYNKAYRAEHADELREKRQAYYADARPVILVKKRAAYRERAA